MISSPLLLAAPVMLSTRIPWAGMYGSIWDHGLDSEAEQWAEYVQQGPSEHSQAIVWAHKEGKLGEFVFDCSNYGQMHRDVAKGYASEFTAWLCDSLGLQDIPDEYEEMTSPRYYNFESDKAFVKFSRTVLQRLLDTVPQEQLNDTFRDMFTSRSGFCSFYSNVVPTKPIDEWDHNELYALLSAWVAHEGVTCIDDELYDYQCGGLYEELGRIWYDNVDWPKLEQLCATAMAEWGTENNVLPEDMPAPLCPDTLELPLG